jgi:hypothetical protein
MPEVWLFTSQHNLIIHLPLSDLEKEMSIWVGGNNSLKIPDPGEDWFST